MLYFIKLIKNEKRMEFHIVQYLISLIFTCFPLSKTILSFVKSIRTHDTGKLSKLEMVQELRHSSLPIVPAMEHALHHNWITRSILSSARAAETVQSSTQTTLNSICGSNAARNYLFNFQYIRQASNWFNRWRCFVHVHTIHVHHHRCRPVRETTCLKRRWVLS